MRVACHRFPGDDAGSRLNSTSHILAGNRVRFDADRSRTIAYDGAWLGVPAPTTAHLGLLLPGVARMNRRLVYSNDLLCR